MAGKIPQSFIDDLLDRTDIVEIIDSRLRLKKTGQNFSALCPFHQEKSPSFSVNPDKQFYYCFGCGSGGNVISFLMDFERTSFVETVENLARHHGLNIPYETNPFEQQKQQAKRSIYDLLQQVSDYYRTQLRQHPERKKATDYLQSRGLSSEVCDKFHIGFAPSGWDNVLNNFGKNSDDIKLLHEAGMLVERENHSGSYDRFRDRLMFPIVDNRGRVIGFGGRVFNNDKPKYLNSPETPVFQKHLELYGLWQARQANRHLNRLIMVEGYMDVVALAQFGINNAVATLGTAAGTSHLEKAFRHTSEIVFCFDGDEAGRKAAQRALEAALPLMQDGRQVRFLFLPDGEDPDSLVRSVGAEQFHWHVEKAKSLSEQLLSICQDGLDLQSPDNKAVFLNRLVPYMQALPETAFKALFLQEISGKVGLSTDKVQQLVAYRDKAETAEEKSVQHQPVQKNKLSTEERKVMRSAARVASALLLFYPHFAQDFAASIQQISNEDKQCQLLLQLYQFLQENPTITAPSMLGHWLHKENQRVTHLLQLTLEAESEEKLRQEFADALAQILKQQTKKAQELQIEQFKQASNPRELSEEQRQAFAQLFQKN